MHTKNGDNMINYYKRSEKAFIKYIKENPNCTKIEWDKYAQDNCLFSANTLMFHLFHEDLIKYLNKRNINKFEHLKDMFLIIPTRYRDSKTLRIILKMQNTKEKVKENE